MHSAESQDWLIWQLADSAFPTGGFSHSSGLEAAWSHGAIRQGSDLLSFLKASLQQGAHTTLPFVIASHREPDRLNEFDQLCHSFTTNHVANRASRQQGRAFILAVDRIFARSTAHPLGGNTARNGKQAPESWARTLTTAWCHFGPLFGAGMRFLGVSVTVAGRLFLFSQMRGMIAAAVRLNIVGPMEGQRLQEELGPWAESLLSAEESVPLDQIAQTAPILDIWQGTHDRLYSRLFQS